MKVKTKKLVSLFLISSLMMLSVNLYAKERRGVKVIITKDSQQIEGELIAVKQNSLLLLNKEGKDESIDIADIKVIRVINKSKVLSGAGTGLLIGGSTGALIGFLSGDDTSGWVRFSAADKALIYGVGLGSIGLLIGAVGGAFAGTDKTFLIEGKNPASIKSILNYLRKKARVRDYK